MAKVRDTLPILFDRVYVVSLPHSKDRRRHIATHLPAMGLEDFCIFDATPADDASVAEAQASGDVLQYPPCFRCGELDCGKPDCNNFLIPPQIANVLTYRRLWQEIIDADVERALIFEDDVLLHSHIGRVLEFIVSEVGAGRLPFTTGQTCLLRLGWARCADHDDLGCRVDAKVKMSNPCHALTRDYAKALVARDKGIRNTSDEYIHRLAPLVGEAFTVYPPIASELSWTEGKFTSTIHPKEVRVTRLRQEGKIDEAEMEAARCALHVKKSIFGLCSFLDTLAAARATRQIYAISLGLISDTSASARQVSAPGCSLSTQTRTLGDSTQWPGRDEPSRGNTLSCPCGTLTTRPPP